MCRSRSFVLLAILLAGGCGKKSTAQLIEDLNAPDTLTQIKAVRTLPERKADAALVIPSLIEALKNESAEVRKGAAFGLGTFGEQAYDAIPALQTAQRDRESDVRRAAAIALSYIDPARFPDASKVRPAGDK